MTSVVRYVTNTTAAGINLASTGADYQLLAIDITVSNAVAAGANANVLQYTGSGTIKTILFSQATLNGSIRMTGAGAAAQDILTVDATGRIINLSIPAGGTAFGAGAILSLLLVVGNY